MEITSKDNAKEIYNSGYGYDHMYHKEYASKGTANTALGFGIAGTAIGLASMFKKMEGLIYLVILLQKILI
jgi:hypothetical protein